jgi:hypothetical protein
MKIDHEFLMTWGGQGRMDTLKTEAQLGTRRTGMEKEMITKGRRGRRRPHLDLLQSLQLGVELRQPPQRLFCPARLALLLR